MCFTLGKPPFPYVLLHCLLSHDTGSSIAEIVSAFPTCGGLCVFPITYFILCLPITSRDRYTASAQLVPKRHRPIVSASHARPARMLTFSKVGWVVGWINMLGQAAGISSTAFGLSSMIWAAVVVAKDGNYEVTSGKVVGLFAGLLIFHGILVRLRMSASWDNMYYHMILRIFFGLIAQNCLATRYLATLTKGFVFINLGTTLSA